MFSMVGTIGVPILTVESRLKSMPKMRYDTLSSQSRGKNFLRENTLFNNYYKRQDLTKEVMVDGWFHTSKIWVYGNSFKSFLVVVVVLKRQALENWALKHDLYDDFKSLYENPNARKIILDELNEALTAFVIVNRGAPPGQKFGQIAARRIGLPKGEAAAKDD
ncbi:hypothetical protein RYX36_037276 [Vicia faba]